MVPPINDIAIISILTIVHLIAIVFTWKVGKVFGSKSWNFILIAFILLLFRRAMNFLDLFEIISYNTSLVSLMDQIYLPLAVWVLIGLGMIRIYYNIKTSIHLERKLKKVQKKTKSKKKSKKK